MISYLLETKKIKGLEKVLTKCAEKGWISEVKRIIEILPESKKIEELEKILIEYVEKIGISPQLKEIAQLLPEPLKTQYIETLKELE